jgi:hypothetical protein
VMDAKPVLEPQKYVLHVEEVNWLFSQPDNVVINALKILFSQEFIVITHVHLELSTMVEIVEFVHPIVLHAQVKPIIVLVALDQLLILMDQHVFLHVLD